MHLRWDRVSSFVFLFLFAGSGALHAQAPVHVFASGLENPRGLTFAPSGDLYVAEAGTSDNHLSTLGECDQVIPPIGPYTGGYNSRISKIDPAGKRFTVLDHLPSSTTNPGSGGFVSGVADLRFVDGQLYVLTAGRVALMDWPEPRTASSGWTGPISS